MKHFCNLTNQSAAFIQKKIAWKRSKVLQREKRKPRQVIVLNRPKQARLEDKRSFPMNSLSSSLYLLTKNIIWIKDGEKTKVKSYGLWLLILLDSEAGAQLEYQPPKPKKSGHWFPLEFLPLDPMLNKSCNIGRFEAVDLLYWGKM